MTLKSLLVAPLLGLCLIGPAHAEEPLPPEQAFSFTAQSRAADHIELEAHIAPGYYLYRDKLRLEVDPPAELGPDERPPGKVKKDEFFGEVQIYRDHATLSIPVLAAADGHAVLTVISQGCADMGVCYPPLRQTLDVALGQPGSTTTAAPPGSSSDAAAGNDLLAAALQRPPTPPAASAPVAPAATPPAASVAAPTPTNTADGSGITALLQHASLPLVLATFFGFGVLLAFTPCCFPMVPILSGIIVGHGHHISRMRAALLSLAYVLGMAVTYALAGVAAGLSGALLSSALQNAWVLGAFGAIFVVLALSMFGFYDLQLPTALQSRLSSSANHQRGGQILGVTIMGALSALIVGPCMAAPLAGALLYIARTHDAALGGSALFTMGLGMGAPLLIIGILARSALPAPGPWMEGVKRSFGVLLLAVALWTTSPVLPAWLVMLGWAVLLIVPGIFLHALDPLPPHAGGVQRFFKALGVLALVAGVAMLVGALAGSRDPLQPLAILRAQAAEQAPVCFQRIASVAELDAQLARATTPVMLDFYADWCVSCKEMERDTFTDPGIAQRLRGMTLLQADVTAATAEDRALLARFGLFGPPGTLFFRPGGEEIGGTRTVGFLAPQDFAPVLDRVQQAAQGG